MSATPRRKPRKRVRIHDAPQEPDVGYAKPPKAHQFKPGQSGNPSGRRKGAKNELTIIQELLQHKVSLTERGKTRKIILLEAILRKVAEDCLKGNVKSVAFLLSRYQAISGGETSSEELGSDDKAVLDTYLEAFKSKLGGKDRPS